MANLWMAKDEEQATSTTRIPRRKNETSNHIHKDSDDEINETVSGDITREEALYVVRLLGADFWDTKEVQDASKEHLESFRYLEPRYPRRVNRTTARTGMTGKPRPRINSSRFSCCSSFIELIDYHFG